MNISKGILALRLTDLRLQSLSQFFPTVNYTSVGITNRNTFKKIQHRSIITNSSQGVALQNDSNQINAVISEKEEARKSKISKSMKAYLQRSVEHEKFMAQKVTEYEIGKRHLANMMGENPETFTQDDINNAIAYLLPSGLFEPRALPNMKHPQELFPRQKEAEFDEMGRPFHSLFYTGKPTFYSLLQQIAIKSQQLSSVLEKMKVIPTDKKFIMDGSKWITKDKCEEMLFEKVSDEYFAHFTRSLEMLIDNPLSSREENFIMKYRLMINIVNYSEDVAELMYKENGIPYMTATGTRKTCKADVTVSGQGTGKVTINGDDILYFDSVQDREQIMFPLQFTGLLRSVDVEATVEGGGKSGQAGALRYALSLALRSFTDSQMIEKMRIAGLLTRDARKKERQKPGQRRARKKFTWKKR